VIESIQEICTLLAGPPLTVQEVASKLGTLIEDQGGNLPLIVRPRDARFTQAMVTRQYGTQRPAYVVLTLTETTELRARALRANFGEYTLLPRRWEEKAPRIKFFLGEPAQTGSTSIIARLMPGEWEDIDGGRVSELTLQPEF
jgi:hypothetical protein